MTFKEFMQENGYDLITTFWGDFSIADKYGIAGVKDTYKRAFNEWKDDYKFFTELTLVLNHKIWLHCMTGCGGKLTELIAELEKLCGKKWVNPYMPEKERFTLTLTDEERSLVEECIKAGYYSTENIEKRREEAHKAKMMKKCAEICERYDKRIRQAEAEKKIMLCVFDYGLSTDNAIYYPHSNTLSFNWNNCENKITQKEFDNFVNNVNRSQLLKGIKFELK